MSTSAELPQEQPLDYEASGARHVVGNILKFAGKITLAVGVGLLLVDAAAGSAIGAESLSALGEVGLATGAAGAGAIALGAVVDRSPIGT